MILKNAQIITETTIIKLGWMEIKNNKIYSINSGKTKLEGINLSGKVIMPGFIDCHTHGGYGTDFESASIEAYSAFAKKITQEGVTRFCQGSVTESDKNMVNSLKIYAEWMKKHNNGNQARQLGCHIEGPFISKAKKGAHELKLLLKPNINLLKKWIIASDNNIKIITYALEEDDNLKFTKFVLKNNIIPSIGHTSISAADFININKKLKINHATHIFNAMNPITHYTIPNGPPSGLPLALLLNDNTLCELISDGIHVNPTLIELILKTKGIDKICLITDSISAKGMGDGNYKLGSLDVVKTNQTVKLASNGALAGSAATFDHCMRTFKEINNLNYLDLSKVTSINVAKNLKIFNKVGSITKNKLADLTILNNKNEIFMTIVEGKIVYQQHKPITKLKKKENK